MLVEKTVLPYEYVVDEECGVVGAGEGVGVYEGTGERRVGVGYWYWEGSGGVREGSIEIRVLSANGSLG